MSASVPVKKASNSKKYILQRVQQDDDETHTFAKYRNMADSS